MMTTATYRPAMTGALLLSLLLATGTAGAAERREYNIILVGNEAGSEIVETLDDGHLRIEFRYEDRGRGPATVTELRLDDAGLPASLSITGVDYVKAPVNESFERVDGSGRWQSAADSGDSERDGFYVPLDGPPSTLAILARALLAADGGRLDLLPTGQARIESVGEVTLDEARTVRHVEIHGLGFEPQPLWLNEDGSLFAIVNSWLSAIESGREQHVETLLARQSERRAQRFALMAESTRQVPDGPVLIDNARIIDVRNGRVLRGNAVLVDHGLIVEVLAPDAPRPDASLVVDAAGRTVLPGLWDMHAHLDLIAGPLNIANGVTTTRDLANDHDELTRIMGQFADGTAIGTHVYRAGIIDGTGEFAGPTRARVETQADADRWVDFYADNGYQQIKIYSSVPVPFVPAMAQRAHDRGLRVSGHIPAGMWAEDAVRAGYDEIQHINMVFLNFYKDVTETRNMDRLLKPARRGADLDVRGAEFLAFVELLKDNDTVVDPTVALFFDLLTQRPGHPKPTESAIFQRLPAQIARHSLKGGFPVSDEDRPRYDASAQRMLDVIRALHEAGVRLVAGTDAMPGFALHSELEMYARAGIPRMDVLRIATLGAAEVMGADDEVGAIEPGLRADLIIVNGRPDQYMGDIRNVDWVMRDGVIYDPSEVLRAIGVQAR